MYVALLLYYTILAELFLGEMADAQPSEMRHAGAQGCVRACGIECVTEWRWGKGEESGDWQGGGL